MFKLLISTLLFLSPLAYGAPRQSADPAQAAVVICESLDGKAMAEYETDLRTIKVHQGALSFIDISSGRLVIMYSVKCAIIQKLEKV